MTRIRLVAPMTDWQELALNAGVTGSVKIRREGKTIRLRGVGVTTEPSAGAICGIPAGMRPAEDVRVPLIKAGSMSWDYGTVFASGGFWGPPPRGWELFNFEISWSVP